MVLSLGGDIMEFIEDVKSAQAGNKASFVKLIRHYEKYFYVVSKSILDKDEDCADAIQETILNCYKNIKSLNNPKCFKAWFTKCLINNCYKILKNNKKIILLDEIEDKKYSKDEFYLVELNHLLSTLDEDLKTVIFLYYFEDLSVKDISNAINVKEGTVKSRLHRARTKLYDILRKDGEAVSYERQVNR
ncbi:RNA polymerase [Clostridium tetani]|uniref:RNA polymerase sigma factor n=2 Tax=Clostridium tetani TaxID=1513 RepID=Q897W3_CLOTE|nr:RNA polymerase sigma factor [Clostridium tetani E88]AVP54823.1 RNA polymerase [Clostridium tetani]QBD84312.1 sigma-70 family RNA polymerase sigma factor [Clostridium tetani]QBD86661.1 sigma-70 family RNA polymerase sigma factor [Clostridium tetani]RXI58369.1 RNA polymerase [Clostridium tetani]